MARNDGPRLGLELHHERPRGAPAPLVYVRSCSWECDIRLNTVGREQAADGVRPEVAELDPREPCLVCQAITLRMRLVYKDHR